LCSGVENHCSQTYLVSHKTYNALNKPVNEKIHWLRAQGHCFWFLELMLVSEHYFLPYSEICLLHNGLLSFYRKYPLKYPKETLLATLPAGYSKFETEMVQSNSQKETKTFNSTIIAIVVIAIRKNKFSKTL
jgi:hypothetical protein